MTVEVAPNAVLCAGRLYCDLVFTGLPHLPRAGAEVFSEAMSLHAGGGAFITAATFQALGWPASLLATVPAPPFDALVREEIAGAGVDAALSVPAPAGAAPQITVAMAEGGDRAFLSHKAGPALPRLDGLNRGWRHLHIGELRTAVEHADLIPMARAAGMSLSLDCGYDAALLQDGAGVAELVGAFDVFLPNEIEYDMLRRSGLPEQACPLEVVKCGTQGARCRSGGAWIERAAAPVAVVDATGAGDAFNGGFLAGWLAGEALGACLEAGNACGAAAVTAAGGTGGLERLRKQPLAAGAPLR